MVYGFWPSVRVHTGHTDLPAVLSGAVQQKQTANLRQVLKFLPHLPGPQIQKDVWIQAGS